MSGSPEEVRHHVAIYKKVAFALALLTITTVGASYLPVAVPVAIVIALIIAITKGSLVASFFMHLVHERSNALVFALALTVVFWFVLMLVPIFTISDRVGEHWTLPNADAPVAHADEAH